MKNQKYSATNPAFIRQKAALVSNAIKFTKTAGEIIISSTEKQNEIMVSVKENGVGIPHSALERLYFFDENYTTTGTNKKLGTTFNFSIPLIK